MTYTEFFIQGFLQAISFLFALTFFAFVTAFFFNWIQGNKGKKADQEPVHYSVFKSSKKECHEKM